MNELDSECSSIVEVYFRAAKHEDGRRDRQIHIVYVIGESAKYWLSNGEDYCTYSL